MADDKMPRNVRLEFELMTIQGALADIQRMVVEAGLRGGFSQERRGDLAYRLKDIHTRASRCPRPEDD